MLMDEGLQLILLGKPQISRDGAPVTGFIYNKALALLAYLAVTKRPHSRESLAGLLWGEMPDAAAKANLRKILSVLRQIAAPNLDIGRQTVAFNRDSNYWLDTDLFESKLANPTATAIMPAEMQDRDVKLLDDAVQLYKGDFLEGFYVRDAPAFEEWVLPERERLRQKMQQALYQLAAHYTARRQYARGIDYTSRLLALEPWHEEVHQQMMLLLALSGQRSAALNQFEICRRLLADELGVEPNRDTVDLHHRIARGEVTSQPASTPTAARLACQKPPPSWDGRRSWHNCMHISLPRAAVWQRWLASAGWARHAWSCKGLLRRWGSFGRVYIIYRQPLYPLPRDSLTLSCVRSLCP